MSMFFFNSECQCCAFLRSEVCYLINELKSMAEIINILKEEATYDRTRNYDQRTYFFNFLIFKFIMFSWSTVGSHGPWDIEQVKIYK